MEHVQRSPGIFKKVASLAMLAISFALLLPMESDAAETLTPAAAINKAGRQRMLSQRMLKLYCQIGLNLSTNKSRTLLENSMQLFDRQLEELRQYADKPDLASLVNKESSIWQQVKPIFAEPTSLKNVRKLMSLSEDLLEAADQLTKAIEKSSTVKSAHLVNLSGRQRMLSQRITKFYMLGQWGIKEPEITKGLETAKKEFESALAELDASPANTRQINEALAKAHTQWEHFQIALSEQQENLTNTGSPILAAIASENLLEVMDKLTGLYEIESTTR